MKLSISGKYPFHKIPVSVRNKQHIKKVNYIKTKKISLIMLLAKDFYFLCIISYCK